MLGSRDLFRNIDMDKERRILQVGRAGDSNSLCCGVAIFVDLAGVLYTMSWSCRAASLVQDVCSTAMAATVAT